MNAYDRWQFVFNSIDDWHWAFYTKLWLDADYQNNFQDFDLMSVGGGPL